MPRGGTGSRFPVPPGSPTPPAELSDSDLVHGARRGDPRAWEGIVDRHLPMVNAIARSHRLSAADREDAVQTVWLTLNQQLPRLRSPESLRSWLRRVTNDVCGRQRRQAARHSPVDPHSLSLADPGRLPDPESHVLDREEREELHRAVGRLTDPRDRSAALDYLGLSHSGRDGPTSATAANQRRRMIRRLRRILEESP